MCAHSGNFELDLASYCELRLSGCMKRKVDIFYHWVAHIYSQILHYRTLVLLQTSLVFEFWVHLPSLSEGF